MLTKTLKLCETQKCKHSLDDSIIALESHLLAKLSLVADEGLKTKGNNIMKTEEIKNTNPNDFSQPNNNRR